MPYIEAITKAGKTIEIERYFSSRYKKKGIKRGDKVKPTKEQQKKVNTRQAEKRLRHILNANFGEGDIHLNLGYKRKRGETPVTKEQMRQDIDKFLRMLRNEYKNRGSELKYVHVMEIGKRGARHHHLVINHIDSKIIQKCWPHGRPMLYPLDETGQYGKLAAYLIKYTDKTVGTDEALQGKRWNCSKNLVRPEPEKRIIHDRDHFKTEPTERKGYYIDKDSVSSGVHSHEYYGYGYMRYTLVKLE